MWQGKLASTMPIVVSANGIIVKSLEEHLRRLSLGSWIRALIQKAELGGFSLWSPDWTLFQIPVGYCFVYF